MALAEGTLKERPVGGAARVAVPTAAVKAVAMPLLLVAEERTIASAGAQAGCMLR